MVDHGGGCLGNGVDELEKVLFLIELPVFVHCLNLVLEGLRMMFHKQSEAEREG